MLILNLSASDIVVSVVVDTSTIVGMFKFLLNSKIKKIIRSTQPFILIPTWRNVGWQEALRCESLVVPICWSSLCHRLRNFSSQHGFSCYKQVSYLKRQLINFTNISTSYQFILSQIHLRVLSDLLQKNVHCEQDKNLLRNYLVCGLRLQCA